MRRSVLHTLSRFVLAGLLFASMAWPAAAQSHAALRHFETGNEHYEQGQYEHALDAYRDALETGYTSGALYYNLGNAYFRIDQIGRAILYYEKALRLLPEDPQLLHSLDIARNRVIAPSPVPENRRGWSVLATIVDPTNTFVLGLLLYLIGVGLLAYRLRTQATGYVRPLYRTTLALGVLLIATALGASYARTLDARGVVVEREVPLHAAPSRQAPQDTMLQEGMVLELQRRQPSWTEVRLPNDRTGWLPAKAVEEV